MQHSLKLAQLGRKTVELATMGALVYVLQRTTVPFVNFEHMPQNSQILGQLMDMEYSARSLVQCNTSEVTLHRHSDMVALTSLTVVVIPTQFLLNNFSITESVRHRRTSVDTTMRRAPWTHICTLAWFLASTIQHNVLHHLGAAKQSNGNILYAINYMLMLQQTTSESPSVQTKWYTHGRKSRDGGDGERVPRVS